MYLHKHASANNISLDPFPFQRELSMEAYIIENPSVLSLESAGLDEAVILLSEEVLLNGRNDRNTDGRIDVLAGYGSEYLAIVELKMGKLENKHLEQLENYLRERRQILEKKPDVWDKEVSGDPKWIGIMVGNSIDPALMLKITSGHSFENEIPIAALTMNRFRGKDGSVYVITDTYFVERISNRDTTKYEFNGQVYGKGRLVLAVLKEYVQRNPGTTYSELGSVFPDHIQGREMFTTEEKALAKSGTKNFTKPEELIALSDSVVAVSNQWGRNIGKFLSRCSELGITIRVASS